MHKKVLCILSLFIITGATACANDCSTQTLSATLGEILELDKVIVEGIEHNRDEPLTFVVKKSVTGIGTGMNEIELSPMKVKIKTNLTTPISISAEFVELEHEQDLHSFDSQFIIFEPNSRVINNPFNGAISDEFVPKVMTTNTVVEGGYEGIVRFTIGAI